MDALILSCGTGGGHDSAAKAIMEEWVAQGNRATIMNPYSLISDGCETKNAAFFLAHGMSISLKIVPKQIIKAICLIADEASCRVMRQNQEKMIHRDAALKICSLASELVRKCAGADEASQDGHII